MKYLSYIGSHQGVLRGFVRYFKYIFLSLAVAFFFYYIYLSRSEIWKIISTANYWYLVLAWAAWLPVHFVSPAFTKIVIQGMGEKFHYVKALDIHATYVPAKYLPGGVWHTVARVTILHRMGFSRKKISSIVFLENLFAPVVSISLGSAFLIFHVVGETKLILMVLSLIISLSALLVGYMAIGKFVLIFESSVSFRRYVRLFFVTALFWVFSSVSFLLFLHAFSSEVIVSSWFEVVGVYLYSWGVGFLAFFAPQGLGVFEVVAANLLSADMPVQSLIVILALFRFITAMADLSFWLLWLLVRNIVLLNTRLCRHLLTTSDLGDN